MTEHHEAYAALFAAIVTDPHESDRRRMSAALSYLRAALDHERTVSLATSPEPLHV